MLKDADLAAGLLALIACTVVSVHAGAAPPVSANQAFSASQAAIGNEVRPVILRDVNGQAFPLARLRGKPLVLSMIYTSCGQVCPLQTRHLGRAVAVARDALGADGFNVVSVGFDTAADTPERMRLFAAAQGIDDPHWYFLSADDAAITQLTEDTGFYFAPAAHGFDHLSQATVIDASGRVYRQVYGTSFPAPALVEPLKELLLGAPPDAGLLETWLDNVRLLCTVYDPGSGHYRFDYSIVVAAVAGLSSLLAIGLFVVRAWKQTA